MAQTPVVQIPGVAHRAADDESIAIDDISEQTELGGFRASVQSSHGRTCPDVDRDLSGGVCTGPEIACRAVADRVEDISVSPSVRSFANNVELRRIHAARFAKFLVPRFRSQIVKTGRARHRIACAGRAEDLREDPIDGRHPAMDLAEQVAIRSAQPAQFRRPIGSAQHAARLGMDFSFVEFVAKSGGIFHRSRVGPAKNRRNRSRFSIQSDKPVPERAPTDGDNRSRTSQCLADALAHRTLQCDRRKFRAALGCVSQRVFALRGGSRNDVTSLIEKSGPRRGTADIDGEDAHVSATAPIAPDAVSVAPSTPRWRAGWGD